MKQRGFSQMLQDRVHIAVGLKMVGQPVILVKTGLSARFGGSFFQPFGPPDPVEEVASESRGIQDTVNVGPCDTSLI